MTHATRLLILAGLLIAAPARAQVDCTNPDNLCTGDPCVMPAVTVISPCQADFGARTLIIDGRLRVPSDGVLSLRARVIFLHAPILSRGTTLSGASVTLNAERGLSLLGPIRLSGFSAGTLELRAGDTIDVAKPVRASGLIGGTITAIGGDIVVRKPIRATGSGRGSPGSIELQAPGPIDVQAPLNASAPTSQGRITITAGGMLTVTSQLRARLGFVILRGTVGVDLLAPVNLTGGQQDGFGQLIAESLNGDVHIAGAVATSHAYVRASAAGDVTLDADVASGDFTLEAGGSVRIRGDVTATAALLSGGVIDVQAADAIDIDGSMISAPFLSRFTGGTIAVGTGATIGITSIQGAIRFGATAGDATLGATFVAPGAIIEATATGDLTASGIFQAAPGGCIGLAAGGILDTSGGTFDVPIVPDCPGS